MMPLHSQDLARALASASQEAHRLAHPFLGTEHLLLGLVAEVDSGAGNFLRRRGFQPRKLRAAVRSLVGRGVRPGETEPPPTLRALGTLRQAEYLAQGYGHPVNTLHLLWSLLQDRDCDGTRLLIDGGAEPATWMAELEELLAEPTRRRPRVFTFGQGDRPAAQVAEASRWRERLLAAGERLREKIVGQDSAVERVADTLTRSWAGLLGAGRPMASFLFVGPRGSGKLTLARNLADFLYGDSERVIRLSLNEFSDELRVLRLLGSNYGAPSEQEGILTRLVQEYPYSVVFLEDIERAHPQAMEGIHQILERGHVFDGRGQRVEFRDNVVILSVAVDPEFFEREGPVGFRLTARDVLTTQERIEREIMPELERVLRADTLGLVDEAVFFPPLGGREMTELLRAWTRELTHEMAQKRNIRISLRPEVNQRLIRRGNEMGQGAGTLRRLFVRDVANSLARAMLENTIREGDSVEVCEVDGEIVVHRAGTKPEKPGKRRRPVRQVARAADPGGNSKEPLGPEAPPEQES
ncbi:MAG: AAA family ATPase [Candidatus Xenobium sp.]|jgi:ATP-dependent Clp protease ATP-binding subunit ClpA